MNIEYRDGRLGPCSRLFIDNTPTAEIESVGRFMAFITEVEARTHDNSRAKGFCEGWEAGYKLAQQEIADRAMKWLEDHDASKAIEQNPKDLHDALLK